MGVLILLLHGKYAKVIGESFNSNQIGICIEKKKKGYKGKGKEIKKAVQLGIRYC